MLAAALIHVLVVGRPILATAIRSVRRRILDQHVLLEFGALGGLLGGVPGFFTTTFSVPDFLGATLFITTYHLLSGSTSGYLRARSARAVAKLVALQPATARVIRDGAETEIPIEGHHRVRQPDLGDGRHGHQPHGGVGELVRRPDRADCVERRHDSPGYPNRSRRVVGTGHCVIGASPLSRISPGSTVSTAVT